MKTLFYPLVLALLFHSPIWADETAKLKKATEAAVNISATTKANIDQMKQYSWKMRTVIRKESESKGTLVYQVRFDLDGKLQRILISDSTDGEKARGIRGKVKAKKAEKASDYVEDLINLSQEYTQHTPGELTDFFLKATITPKEDNLVEVKGHFRSPFDELKIVFDRTTFSYKTLTFKTTHEDKLVNGTVIYRTREDGLTYAAKTQIMVPEEEFIITTENFDYLKQ